MGNKGRRI